MAFNTSGLQILANYCVAAAESMAHTLVRTAHSTFVKETEGLLMRPAPKVWHLLRRKP
ncbi:hypothetical protein LZ023_36680 (plasmid) [Pseudomonas silvicola]|nr:hypothetical protein LZ023_36680 [Pseudomonas silvicola]